MFNCVLQYFEGYSFRVNAVQNSVGFWSKVGFKVLGVAEDNSVIMHFGDESCSEIDIRTSATARASVIASAARMVEVA